MSDTTDLYSAAESLLSPELTGPENPVEDQTETDDVSDDDQDISEDVDLSDEDDAEPSDSVDEEDVELDFEDEETADDTDTIEDDASPQTFTVKVDGKEEQWTLEQLTQSASGQAAIKKRMEFLADDKRQLDELASTLKEQEALLNEAFQALQSGQNLRMPTPPSQEMLKTDPIGFIEAKEQYEAEMAAYQQNMQKMSAAQRNAQERQRQELIAKRDMEAKKLAELIPEYGDPERREAFARNLIKAAEVYDFTQEEMMGMSDSRYILALNDARKYQEIVARRKSAEKKVSKTPATPPIKAGAKKVKSDSASAARKKAENRLRRTGSIQDAVDLIFKS